MNNVQAMIEKVGGLEALAAKPIRIENSPYMTLCIEHIGTGLRGLPLVSIAHYGEQNGDLMRDPDIVFEVATDGLQGWRWLPVSFRNDYAGVDELCIWEEGGSILVHAALVWHIQLFAKTWDAIIAEQGYPSAFDKQRAAAQGATL